jgi:hypothetical protein
MRLPATATPSTAFESDRWLWVPPFLIFFFRQLWFPPLQVLE